jgi:hypothetical protein
MEAASIEDQTIIIEHKKQYIKANQILELLSKQTKVDEFYMADQEILESIDYFVRQGFSRCFSRSENAELFGKILFELSRIKNLETIDFQKFFEDSMPLII